MRTERRVSVVREQDFMFKKNQKKNLLKVKLCAELLADIIVSDWSLEAVFTLLVHHQRQSPNTGQVGEPDDNKTAKTSQRKTV